MSIATLFMVTLLIAFILVMVTLSTSVLYALTQILSSAADFLFDLRGHGQSRV